MHVAVLRIARSARTWALGLFLLGLTQHRSHHPVLFGWWSGMFAAVVGFCAVGLIASAVAATLRDQWSVLPPNAMLVRAGAVIWSLAYATSALIDPEQGGRIFELAVVGSPYAIPSALEWIALVLLLVAGTWKI